MIRLAGLTLVGLLLALPAPVCADFDGSIEKCAVLGGCYRLSGNITDQDAARAKAMVDEVNKLGASTPLVTLDSRGGSVVAAMQIGRYLRQTSAIATVPRGAICLSSCVFVLAGATQRVIGGRVGVHRPFSPRTGYTTYEQAQGEYSRLAIAAKKYLSDMNIPESLYDAMIRTPAEDIRILDASELVTFGLGEKDPVFDEQMRSLDAEKYGLSKQEYLRRYGMANKACNDVLQTGNVQGWEACHERIMRSGRPPASSNELSTARPVVPRAIPQTAGPTLYKCADARGAVTYTDSPCVAQR